MSIEQCTNCKYNPKRYYLESARFVESKWINCHQNSRRKLCYLRGRACPYYEKREPDPTPDIPKIEESLNKLVSQFGELTDILKMLDWKECEEDTLE